MIQNDFNILSADLRKLAINIPLRWGAVQNNRTDDNINMFKIHTYSDLEYQISRLSENEKNYLRRRWYLWKCSECDEYLFYKNQNVIHNPDPFDKKWDIRINNKYDFDIKGTVIPASMRDNFDSLIKDPTPMVEFFYDNQSKGRRYDIQNRLFIVHHSLVGEEREMSLRCEWEVKERAYRQFCENVEHVSLIKYKGVSAGVIFIVEDKDDDLFMISHLIWGLS